MHTRDIIGERGESIFRVLITRKHPVRGFLFDSPRFLGEKQRTTDFLIELFHGESLTPYLFVQVRATSRGYTANGRLKVKTSGAQLNRLAAYPAPTYVVGIDEVREQGYIVSANGEWRAGFSSMCTAHPFGPEVLSMLWHEVVEYWTIADRSAFRSALTDPRLKRSR